MKPACLLVLATYTCASALAAADGEEFFEKNVRPLFAQQCQACHSSPTSPMGGLRLDSREGWAKGGDAGPAIVPGDLDKSLVIEAVRYKNKDLQMPEKRKLPDAEIAILEQWVKMGAPDPRTGGTVAKKQTGLSIEEGKNFWSYIPPKKFSPPTVKDTAWPRGDIDRFILAEMEKKGVKPAPDAAHGALLRRITYNLIGLPPTPEQMDAFEKSVKANPQSAVESLVD